MIGLDVMRTIDFSKTVGAWGRRHVWAGFALAALCVVLLGTGCVAPESAPRAVDGRMDLSGWDFDAGNVDLQGRWSVCWGQLLLPGDDCSSGWSTVGVRGIWSDDSARSPFGGKGLATYRLLVALPQQSEHELTLAAGAPMTAYRLWIGGESRGGSGVVGRDGDATSSEPRRNRVFSLPLNKHAKRQEVEIWVQLANFEFRGGGIRRPWVVGRPDAIQRTVGVLTVRDALLAAISVIIGAASLVQFALRRSELSRLYFGLFSMVMAVRMVPGSISDFTQIIVPWATFSQLLRAEYAGTAFAMVFGLGYIGAKFPDWTPPRLVAGLQLVSLAIAPIILLAPLAIVIETLPFFLVMPPVSIGFMIAVCARAWWRGATEVRVTLVASLIFSVAVIHDVIRASVTDFGLAIELFPYFFVVWLSAEAYELAERFARKFRSEEALAFELADLNFELQETESAVARFIPFDLLTMLGKESVRDVESGDHVQAVVSVLHCDLGGLLPGVAELEDTTVARRMNDLVQRVMPLVQNHGGFINGVRGDGLQAIFPDGADAATRAAFEILATLRTAGDPGVGVGAGIGIDTGPLLLGVLGEEGRLVGSAIGPAVERAERIALLTRDGVTKLLVGSSTRDAWSEAAHYSARAFVVEEEVGHAADDLRDLLAVSEGEGGS